MPAKDFKFISPGVFINEIDNSQLLQAPGDIGPVIIGRSQQGPGLIPTTVNSFQEFVQMFGAPVAGGTNRDVFRNGNSVGPTYGTYAAQAWLRNNPSVTYVRLVGKKHQSATNSSAVDNSGFPGWKTTKSAPDVGTIQGGAWGLFVVQSGSAEDGTETDVTGTLAAIWYVNSGSVALSGTTYSGSGDGVVATAGVEIYPFVSDKTQNKGTNQYFRAAAGGEWKAVVTADGEEEIDTKFNFNESSENFIRKVFNTNPIRSNASVTDDSTNAYVNYFLGETYEDAANANLDGAAGDQYAFIAPLYTDDINGGNFQRDYSDPHTGWFFSQDLGTNTGSYLAGDMQKLFRIVAKNTGRWASRNVKISIDSMRATATDDVSYGTFSVVVRAMDDTDNRPKVLERFDNCNLNPQTPNYVGRKIGNKYLTWSDDNRRWTEYGDFESQSDYIYMDMDPATHEGNINPQCLPFGVYGPPAFNDFYDFNTAPATVITGGYNYSGDGSAFAGDSLGIIVSASAGFAFSYPKLRLRVSASEGNPTDPRNVWFGVDTTFNRSGRPSKTIGAYTGPIPAYYSEAQMFVGGDASQKFSFIFTLDDMCNTSTELTGTNVYVSGSRNVNPDSSVRGGLTYINSGSWKGVLDNGVNQFTTVLHGGFDGLNIKEAEPFRNTIWSSATEPPGGVPTEKNSYTFNSVKVAIDSLRDPEAVEFNLAAMPGITNNTLNRNLVDMCEDRGDALAVIDLQGGYVPETENTESITDRIGSVRNTINNKQQNLQTNSSFGCAYYPWVQIQDTINGAIIWAPPSIAAIGAMSYGQATQELWFAPAGFTRGGLSANAAAGIPVVGVRERLVSKNRDKLYEANVNPIAQFPAEGIVIFGQKTLQMTPSALDRVNVRRLLIYLKRQISRIAATLLFDQNVDTTWNRFRGRVGPLLANVQAGLGLADYKLVLDETTTTPDLIDRNIMYAQIFLKPARAIEFIAIDFVITDSGASFED